MSIGLSLGGDPKKFYKQCVLKKKNTYTTTWVPERFAKKGKKIKIKEDGKWSYGWVVESVGARQSERAVFMMKDSYRYHRRVTDV